MRAAPWIVLATLLLAACARESPKGVRAWFPPHQTWQEGRSFVALPDSDMTQNDPLSGPLLQELDARGRVIRRLEPPPGLLSPTWFAYRPRILWVDGTAWTCGIPAHPGWYRLYRKVHKPWPAPRRELNHPHFLLPRAAGTLFRSRGFGPWEAVARFRTDTGFGYVTGFVPLRDGTFLGLAHSEFARGLERSPLARFRINPQGWLEMEELMPLAPSDELPATSTEGRRDLRTSAGHSPGSTRETEEAHSERAVPLVHDRIAKGREVRDERGVAQLFMRIDRVITTPKGLVVLGSGGGMALLDPAHGRPLRLSSPPCETGGLDHGQAQPAPDGTFVVRLLPKGRLPQIRNLHEPQSPASQLVEFAFARRLYGGEKPAFCYRVDPATGTWTALKAPAGSGSWPRNRHLRIRPDGALAFWDPGPGGIFEEDE